MRQLRGRDPLLAACWADVEVDRGNTAARQEARREVALALLEMGAIR